MIRATISCLVIAAALMALTQKMEWWTMWGYAIVLGAIAGLLVFASHFYAQATNVGTVSSVVFQVLLVSVLTPVVFAGLLVVNAVLPLHAGRSNESEWGALFLPVFTALAGYIVTPFIGALLLRTARKPDAETSNGQT
jgi:hypothetical protein